MWVLQTVRQMPADVDQDAWVQATTTLTQVNDILRTTWIQAGTRPGRLGRRGAPQPAAPGREARLRDRRGCGALHRGLLGDALHPWGPLHQVCAAGAPGRLVGGR